VPAAPAVTSSKLAALMEMLCELASEGRRVLVFFAIHLDARFDQARTCCG
jgi:hypothetical protein